MAAAMTVPGACGDSSTSSGGTLSAGPTSATTESSGTSGAPGSTGTTSAPTTGGSVGETEVGATAGTTTSPATTTLETTTTTTTTATGTSGTEGETTAETGGVATPCVTVDDCQLVDDCCSCEVIGPGEAAPACDIQVCLQSTCAGYKLEEATLECRHGVCSFAKNSCNPLGVLCKALPPNCGPGEVPGVSEDENGKCWSGACLPAEACDWVPDCSYCEGEALVCVLKGQKGAYHVCEARPLDCPPGEIDCGCGQQICDNTPPHTQCNDATPGIECECPFC